jgi:hypothetical protein
MVHQPRNQGPAGQYNPDDAKAEISVAQSHRRQTVKK